MADVVVVALDVTASEETKAAEAWYHHVTPLLDDLPSYFARKEAVLNALRYLIVKEGRVRANHEASKERQAMVDVYNDFAVDAMEMVSSMAAQGSCTCRGCELRRSRAEVSAQTAAKTTH